jgi:ATP-dependent exoDNAse (exonuclease V) beta subunit
LRSRVLSMIDLLRGLGDKGRDRRLLAPALARLDAIYGTALSDPAAARDTLQAAIQMMVTTFPEGGMAQITAKGNIEKLEKDLTLFKRVHRAPDLLDRDWKLWNDLRSVFVSNRSSKTPEGYDDLATAIMVAADLLPAHPGPLADAKLHLSCLIACAQEVMEAYEARKKALGLIDFADMITGAERLLRTDPDVRQAVLDEIDCVIIDEFQDTNPVQFALLWQLGAHAPRTLLVGDVKQSIMGFQGADPRLSQALAMANPGATQPLDRNWRSTPGVMQFVNSMGAGLFGAGYNSLTPTRDSISGPALEVLNAVKSRGVRTASKPQEHIAERIACILKDGETVTDRFTKAARPARPSDIALLVCRHATAARYAEELRARGVPVRISEDGWSTSPAVVAARSALAFAANPTDIHSGLLLRTLGPDPLSLQAALTAQSEGRLCDDLVLTRLAALSDEMASLPIGVALDLVLSVTDIRLWADSQPDAAGSRADLLRLEAEASEFEGAHRDLKAASGFLGETAKVFLGWLDARAGERDFDRRPDPSVNNAEAVEIVTWHASKGREWPIVVLAELDNAIEDWPGSTTTRFDALDRLDDMTVVLGSAALVHTPGFAAPEATRRFVEDRRADFEANARNLLYVALTRARDRVILEWPGFLKERKDDAPEAVNLFHILMDNCAPQIGTACLTIGGINCPAVIKQLPEHAGFTEYASGVTNVTPRLGPATPLAATPLSPWRLQPSQNRSTGVVPETYSLTLGEPWSKTLNDAARGTALHLALRTYLTRPDLASELASATALDEATLELISERATALKNWLAAEGYTDLAAEIPVLGFTQQGAEIPGTIDLLAIGSKGCLIIDHKSGGIGEGLGPYWPQLSSYAGLVAKLFPQHPLNGLAVFWVDHGRLELANVSKSSVLEFGD